MPSADDLAKFIVERTPDSGLEIVLSCIADNSKNWRLFLGHPLVCSIVEDEKLQKKFFKSLCGESCFSISAPMIDTFLRCLPSEQLAMMMNANSLAKKEHPANLAFYGSTFNNEDGKHFIDVFTVFVNHGLTPELVDEIADRNFSAVVRACKLSNEQFLTAIIPYMTCLPTRLAKSIVASPDHAEKLIALLTTKYGVSLSTFTDPAVLMAAKPTVANYIEALDARDMSVRARSKFSF